MTPTIKSLISIHKLSIELILRSFLNHKGNKEPYEDTEKIWAPDGILNQKEYSDLLFYWFIDTEEIPGFFLWRKIGIQWSTLTREISSWTIENSYRRAAM